MIEESARESYLEARAARLGAERELARFAESKRLLVGCHCATLQDRIALEASLNWQDELEANQRIAIEVLHQEEAARRADWIQRRNDLKVLEKLRERAYDQWQIDERRREQREMDEFAVIGASR